VREGVLLDGAGGVHHLAATAPGSDVAGVSGAPGGYLLIHHGPGLVMAWTAGLLEDGSAPAPAAGEASPAAATVPDRAAAAVADRPSASGGSPSWQAPLASPALTVTAPATVPLHGRFTHLAVSTAAPAVLHVRASAPAVTLLRRAGAAAGVAAAATATAPRDAALQAAPAAVDTVAIHPAGVRLDAYLPIGVAHLGLTALGEAELGGFAEITTTAVLPAGEGLGPEVLLPAGDTRYFSFHVAGRRTVGWAAAAGAERVSCRLLRGDGRAVAPQPLGTGKPAALADMLAMAELDEGDYLLALTAPADAAPVRARPVLVGLDLPDTGPPPEVIRQYLQEAGAVVPATAPGSHP
jgi:hypothetical protein